MSSRDPYPTRNAGGSTAHGNYKPFSQPQASQANTGNPVLPVNNVSIKVAAIPGGSEADEDDASPRLANAPSAQNDDDDAQPDSQDEIDEDADDPALQDAQEKQDSDSGGAQAPSQHSAGHSADDSAPRWTRTPSKRSGGTQPPLH